MVGVEWRAASRNSRATLFSTPQAYIRGRLLRRMGRTELEIAAWTCGCAWAKDRQGGYSMGGACSPDDMRMGSLPYISRRASLQETNELNEAAPRC